MIKIQFLAFPKSQSFIPIFISIHQSRSLLYPIILLGKGKKIARVRLVLDINQMNAMQFIRGVKNAPSPFLLISKRHGGVFKVNRRKEVTQKTGLNRNNYLQWVIQAWLNSFRFDDLNIPPCLRQAGSRVSNFLVRISAYIIQT